MQKPIFLIGMMGSGKSSVGERLAKDLHLPFFDVDTIIEINKGVSVSTIFETEGELAFRMYEANFIDQLSAEPQIISCGGGLPCAPQMMEKLLNKGLVIFLAAPSAVLLERLKGENNRPLLKTAKDFEALYLERRPIYAKAHFQVDASPNLDRVVENCLEIIESRLS
jgi:shikimate kinase